MNLMRIEPRSHTNKFANLITTLNSHTRVLFSYVKTFEHNEIHVSDIYNISLAITKLSESKPKLLRAGLFEAVGLLL